MRSSTQKQTLDSRGKRNLLSSRYAVMTQTIAKDQPDK